jgi:hypothetical protein
LSATRSDRPLSVRSVLRLHQTIGNREVQRLIAPPPVPPASARHGFMERLAVRWRRLRQVRFKTQ